MERMKIIAFAPLVVLAACASAAAAPIEQLGMQRSRPDARCDVEVSFGSACCGINGKAHAGVSALIARSRGIAKAVEWSWGREGERTLCVATTTPAAADALYAAIAASRYPTDNHATTTVTRGQRHATLE
jgi:hypothetical protein